MKTVSTLCATSTVGIAVCGFALGRPQELQHQQDRFLSTASSTGSHSNSTGIYTDTPSSLSIEPPSTPTSSKKAWYRRISSSLSSASSLAPSTSPTSSASRSVATPSPGPSLRNRLVKQPPSRAASPAVGSAFSSKPRPATALTPRRSSLLSPIRSLRPATSVPQPSCAVEFRHYDPQPVGSWRGFFTVKKHFSAATSIKRIYPDHLYQPTLVLAHVITDDSSDTSSVYSGQSVYYESRPHTTTMPQVSPIEPPPSPVQGIRIRRSFSISNIIHHPRLPSRNGTRHSSLPAEHWLPQPTPYHTPSENFPPSPLPRPHPGDFQYMPPIHSVSVLNIDVEPELFTLPPTGGSNADGSGEHATDLEQQMPPDEDEVENILQNDSIYRPQRLSILTNAGSERASTLIGSDAGEDTIETQTDNGFDSMRTRVNEGVTPVRVESIFDLSSSAQDSSPLVLKKSPVPYVEDIDNISPTSDVFRGLTPPPNKLEGWIPSKAEENDSFNWGGDWDVTKNKAEIRTGPLAASRKLDGSPEAPRSVFNLDNESKSSVEDWTEWANDGDNHSIFGSSPASNRQSGVSWRPQTSYSKGKSALAPGPKEGSGYGNTHVRSQSLPVRTARHMPSENWDDDFDGFGLGPGELNVPQIIQERQQTIRLHLESVKEFATLVEDLKKLMELGLSTGVRWGTYSKMWDEAEGVIALASTGTVGSESYSANDAKVPPSLDDFSDEEDNFKDNRKKAINNSARRASILSPDDDVFGVYSNPTARPSRSFERLSPRHAKTFSTSSNDSRSTSGANKSDPLAMAKALMERIQHTSAENMRPGSSSSSLGANAGKMQFDTQMLGPLLDKVRKLLTSLETSLKEDGPLSISRDTFELGMECSATGVTVN